MLNLSLLQMRQDFCFDFKHVDLLESASSPGPAEVLFRDTLSEKVQFSESLFHMLPLVSSRSAFSISFYTLTYLTVNMFAELPELERSSHW